MKAQKYSSRYLKTIYQEDLMDSTPITISLTPYDDLMSFLKDLITDLIQKRNIENERILILTESAWLKHALNNCLESTFDTQMDNLLYNRTILICDTQSVYFIEQNYQFSVCIALNYIQISENKPEIFDAFIDNNKNTLFIGIDDQSSTRELLIPLLGAGVREVSYDLISFEPFLNREILLWLNNLLGNYHNYPEIIEASELIFGKLDKIDTNKIDSDNPYLIQIGTSSFVETENDEESQESSDIKEFLINISFSRYQIDFSVELQDFDWDGTSFYNYTLNIEDEIEETISGDVGKFEEFMNEVKDRLNRYRNDVNFKFEGFDLNY